MSEMMLGIFSVVSSKVCAPTSEHSDLLALDKISTFVSFMLVDVNERNDEISELTAV